MPKEEVWLVTLVDIDEGELLDTYVLPGTTSGAELLDMQQALHSRDISVTWKRVPVVSATHVAVIRHVY